MNTLWMDTACVLLAMLMVGCGRAGPGTTGAPSADPVVSVVSAPPGDASEPLAAPLTGYVRTPTGEPIVGAFVYAVGLPGNEHTVKEIAIFTRKDGRYYYTVLLPGRYRVSASAEGYAAQEHTVTIIDEDEVVRQDFVLQPMTT